MFIVPLLFVPWVTVIVGLVVAVIGFRLVSVRGGVRGFSQAGKRRRSSNCLGVLRICVDNFVDLFRFGFGDVDVSKKVIGVVNWIAYGYWFVALINFWISEFVFHEPTGPSVVLITVTLLIGIGTWNVGLARKCRFEEQSVWERFPRRILIAPFVYSTLWSCIYIFRAATFKEMEWAVWLLILPNAGSIIWVFWSWPYGGFKRIGNPWRGGTG